MAKAGFWLQGARGKVAGAKLSKGEKGTIMSQLVAPSNPQTNKQMANRIIFATVSQARAAMKPLISHSFEGITSEKESLRFFTKENVKNLRELASDDYGDFNPRQASVFCTTKGISTLIPNRYLISKGSLNPAGISIKDFDNYETYLRPNLDINSVDMTEGAGSVTPQDILNILGLEFKDELTIAGVCTVPSSSGDPEVIYRYDQKQGHRIVNAKFKALRLVMRDNVDLNHIRPYGDGGDTLPEAISKAFNELIDDDRSDSKFVETMDLVLRENVTVQDDKFIISNSNYSYNILNEMFEDNYLRTTNVYAAGFIRSHRVGEDYKRSTCYMYTADIMDEDHTFGLTWDIAIDAWFKGLTIANDGRFLDEGGDANSLG